MADAETIYREGFQEFAQGRLDEAVAAYRRAIEVDPEYAKAWNALAAALGRQGDLDGAIDAGRRYVELAPDDPLGHTSLSMLYQRKGWIQEAEDEKAAAARLQSGQGS